MSLKYAIRGVPVERLQLSKAPTAELAGAAMAAQAAAGLEQASFLVIAVDPDQIEEMLAAFDSVGKLAATP